MPKNVPSYCLHKASGQAYVKIRGKRIYLGKHGTPKSHKRYADEIAKWQARQTEQTANVSIKQLTLLYLKRCESHYRKNGEITSEVHCIRMALRQVNRKYRDEPADKFSPMMLAQVRISMMESGDFVRNTINASARRIVRCWKWAVSQGLVSVTTWQALTTLQGLQEGRCDAADSEPVKPVPLALVDAVRPHIAPALWGAIQFQLATAARPAEALAVRFADIDRGGDVWIFEPGQHKNQHHGKRRIILIGPQGQSIIKEHATTDPERFIFGKTNGSRYRRDSFTTAIRRACERAFGMPKELRNLKANGPEELRERAAAWRAEHCWAPNQLRHTAATNIRKAAGKVEVSKTILGHSEIRTTELYAERDLAEAAEIILKIG